MQEIFPKATNTQPGIY